MTGRTAWELSLCTVALLLPSAVLLACRMDRAVTEPVPPDPDLNAIRATQEELRRECRQLRKKLEALKQTVEELQWE